MRKLVELDLSAPTADFMPRLFDTVVSTVRASLSASVVRLERGIA